MKHKSQTTPKLSKTRSQKKNLHLKKIKKRRYNHQANTIVAGVGIVKNEQSRNQPQVRHNQSTNQAYKPTPKCRPFNRPRKNNSNRAHAPHNPPQCIHPQERSVREQDQNQTGADQRFEVGGGGSIKKRANATHIQKKKGTQLGEVGAKPHEAQSTAASDGDDSGGGGGGGGDEELTGG